jgi:hypothetical protein
MDEPNLGTTHPYTGPGIYVRPLTLDSWLAKDGTINLHKERRVPTYERGDFIKVEFENDVTGIGEWMWVRVQSCDDENRLVFGVLDNAPVSSSTPKLRLGSELAVSFDKIREHRKASEF